MPAPITLAPGFKDVTAAQQQDQQLQRRLQQDSIQLAGKTIYINPFLYWRRFDSNTDRWLREPGQLNEDQIQHNRGRFYPELEWSLLDPVEQEIKDGVIPDPSIPVDPQTGLPMDQAGSAGDLGAPIQEPDLESEGGATEAPTIPSGGEI